MCCAWCVINDGIRNHEMLMERVWQHCNRSCACTMECKQDVLLGKINSIHRMMGSVKTWNEICRIKYAFIVIAWLRCQTGSGGRIIIDCAIRNGCLRTLLRAQGFTISQTKLPKESKCSLPRSLGTSAKWKARQSKKFIIFYFFEEFL